jgi:hypothetical protein
MIKLEETSENNPTAILYPDNNLSGNVSAVEKKAASSDTTEVMSNENTDKNMPEKILISVPFASQAPFAVWDEIHEEACEEASLVMVKYYLDKKALTPKTKAVICVHLGHQMTDMDALMTLAEKHNLIVIEDCAHAHGAKWRGKGAGTLGHFGSFSLGICRPFHRRINEGNRDGDNRSECGPLCWVR